MQRLSFLPRAVLLVWLLAAACGPATPPATTGPLQHVIINYPVTTGGQAALWYAYEEGLFQKYGVEPELTNLRGSGSEVLSAMLRGEVHLATGGASTIINSVAAGEERVIIASFYNGPVFELVAGADIQSPEDLIGKSIAVGSLGGFRHKMTLTALDQLGIEPEQVNFVPFRDSDEAAMAAAIEGGSVSAAVLSPPLLSRYQALGMHVMVDLSATDIAYLRLAFGGLRSYIAENRPAVLGVLKALLEAIPLMRADPEGTQAALAKYTGLDPVADAADLAAMYTSFVTLNVQPDLYPSQAAFDFTLELETLTNPDTANLTMEQVVDLSLLDEIRTSGFMDTLP